MGILKRALGLFGFKKDLDPPLEGIPEDRDGAGLPLEVERTVSQSSTGGPTTGQAEAEEVAQTEMERRETKGSSAEDSYLHGPASEGQRNMVVVLEQSASDADNANEDMGSEGRSLPGPSLGPGLRFYYCAKENRRPGDCDIIVPQSVYQRIVSHVSSDLTREQGGLLLGWELHNPGSSRKTTCIITCLPAKHTHGNAVELTFTEDTWAEFDREIDEMKRWFPDLKRLGWYHSHPGHGVFLSSKDLNFCATFTRETGLALVVDPRRNEGGFFVNGAERKYRSDAPQGFCELLDRTSNSMVTWENMKVSGVEAGELSLLGVHEELSMRLTQGSDSHQSRQQLTDERQESGEPGKVLPDNKSQLASVELEYGSRSISRASQQSASRFGVPPYVVILIAVVFPFVLAYVVVSAATRSFREGMNTSVMQNLEHRIARQEETLKRQFERLEAVEKLLSDVRVGAVVANPQEAVQTDQGRGGSAARDSQQSREVRRGGSSDVTAPQPTTEQPAPSPSSEGRQAAESGTVEQALPQRGPARAEPTPDPKKGTPSKKNKNKRPPLALCRVRLLFRTNDPGAL